MPINKIDYSQLSKFKFCPWAWYENYVNGMQPRYVGQRSDALCLGSLVHNALDNIDRTGKMFIDESTLVEMNPTPETKLLAELMVAGFRRKYPMERWECVRTEAAVEFPLDPYSEGEPHPWTGVAKLDKYFFVPEDTTIESGLPDSRLTLGRGWWAKEYKTKSHGIPRPTWMKEWASKMQADFQLLALQNLLAERGEGEVLRGVLVSVLEKPREYTPKRKCKGCGNQYELESFFVGADGHHCPMCNHVQILKPYTPTVPAAPEYFQMIVTRTPEQLERARREIAAVAESMEEYIESNDITSLTPDRDNCINNRYHKQCAYAEQHIAGAPVSEPTFVKIDPYRYIGLPQ